MWFLVSAQADGDLLLLLSSTEPQIVLFKAGLQRGPSKLLPSHPMERCHSIWGGEQGLGPPLSALLCLLNLRASARTGKPGKHGLLCTRFFKPFLVSICYFWPR